MLKKGTFYTWNQNCTSAEGWVLQGNLGTKGAPLAVKLHGSSARGGGAENKDVLNLPCQEPRSFHGNVLAITSLRAERTRRCGGDLETAGSARVETYYTLWLAVGPRCPQSPCKHQSSASGFMQPPVELQMGLGEKVLSQSLWLWAASKEKSILPLSKVKARLQKKSQSDPHKSYQPFFFPKHFVTLTSNRIT